SSASCPCGLWSRKLSEQLHPVNNKTLRPSKYNFFIVCIIVCLNSSKYFLLLSISILIGPISKIEIDPYQILTRHRIYSHIHTRCGKGGRVLAHFWIHTTVGSNSEQIGRADVQPDT